MNLKGEFRLTLFLFVKGFLEKRNFSRNFAASFFDVWRVLQQEIACKYVLFMKETNT